VFRDDTRISSSQIASPLVRCPDVFSRDRFRNTPKAVPILARDGMFIKTSVASFFRAVSKFPSFERLDVSRDENVHACIFGGEKSRARGESSFQMDKSRARMLFRTHNLVDGASAQFRARSRLRGGTKRPT